MIWNKKKINPEKVKTLASKHNLSLITASILQRRGIIDSERLKFYIESDLRYLHNPFLFIEMEDFLDRILSAKEEGEKVRIFGDRDVDGITSTVMLVTKLKAMGLDVSWSLPEGDDPYGLTTAGIDEFAEEDGSLIITVDCGISNIKEIEYAESKGIDTLIIDHHNPQETLPAAKAIINPKVPDSGYPFRDLAGCGVTAKVIWALEFSSKPYYNRTFIILNIRPGNETYILDAVKIINMAEVDRISETIVPGMLDLSKSRLGEFLTGNELLVYDAVLQKKMLLKVFGNSVEIGLTDIAPEIWRIFPPLSGKSILNIREKSRMAKYLPEIPSEIDLLVNLFKSYILKNDPGLSDEYIKIFDLTAMGTIADLMPLENENRIIVRRGMAVLNKTERKGLRELLIKQNLTGKKLSTTDVGWQLTPVINASGRLGVPGKAADLFLTDNISEKKSLAAEVVGLNKERKKRADASWEKVFPQAKRSLEELNNKLVLTFDKKMNRGITGIIASKLVKYFNVPSISIAILPDTAVGSMRSTMGYNVKTFLDNFSNLFIDYGGHDFAAGFSLTHSNFTEFQKKLIDFSKTMEPFKKVEEKIEIDAELPLSFFNPDIIDVVEWFEPYGQGNPPLVFLSKGIKIISMDIIGKTEKQHLRMMLDSGKFKWPAVFWNAADRVPSDFNVDDVVDIVFRLGRNYFQNRENIQLTILDVSK